MSYKCGEGKNVNITRYTSNINNQTSGCYLTTMISTILGHPDNGYALSMLKKLRNEYMLNNPAACSIRME